MIDRVPINYDCFVIITFILYAEVMSLLTTSATLVLNKTDHQHVISKCYTGVRTPMQGSCFFVAQEICSLRYICRSLCLDSFTKKLFCGQWEICFPLRF